eukprot:CAMPEP_0195031674 /NCGR_PEP_ID=MMETSP0326_2-20130528/61747_1 /TAXON_ID=2866 ORGANISM="Crypthecodinium cohnii, Strain Seligo" /NCGR_SAMPLE_ID=MMETSP0326_2 /ASSEMBLY_ACC=CAM_ASM_000348 /LENGTH=74 /DNA_ID=CAMNT_0040055493 /DNA_START=220 /DNA_END=440 /DNA_ORIENTATION=+
MDARDGTASPVRPSGGGAKDCVVPGPRRVTLGRRSDISMLTPALALSKFELRPLEKKRRKLLVRCVACASLSCR